MLKTLNNQRKLEKERYAVPRRVQDVIPIRRVWKDGVFLCGNLYTKTFQFSDINYRVASREDKESMFLSYSELLNSLDSGASAKLSINNRRLNKSHFEDSILMPLRGDFRDEYREEYNQMLLDKATGANGIMQEKYLTLSVAKKNVEEARAYFARVGADLTSHFAALGSKCRELDAGERLRILHDFYRPGEEDAFHFDLAQSARLGHSFKDAICPDSVERFSDHLKLGDKYCRVLYLKEYANYIKDEMVNELTDLNRNLMLSIDILPVPTDEAVREVENRLLGVETNITNWQRRQNQNNNFSAVIPYDMELQRKESKEFLNDLTTRDQRMMLCVLTLVIMADSFKQLQSDTESIQSVARKQMCQMAVLKFQQMDGLNTALPMGVRKINAFRTLTTESLAVFMPFKVQEIQDKGGIYFGENAISHNLLLCNKSNLLNQSAFQLGVPGSGKSFLSKEQIAFLILNTEDDVLICDPENEFGPLCQTLGREAATVVHMAAGGKDRLNAMYMVEGYGEQNPIVEKSQFVMSLIEQIDRRGVGPQHKSIIDRCTALVYQEAERVGKPATLCDLREKLLEQPEGKAQDIALSLELFTTGSLDIFGKESTVDLDKRIVVFDIHSLGEQLKPTGLLVITDTILNRVTLNWKRGKRTHVFIDEFHVVFENEQSGIFFSGEDTGTGQTIRTAIAQVNQEYQDKLEEIQSSHTYDTLEITGSQAVWKEVLAVYAVKTTTDPEGRDVASMDEEKLGLLAEVFWEMNQLSANVETRTETTQNEDGEAVKSEITVLVISVSHKTAQEMAVQLGFDDSQKEQLQELLSPEYDDLWNELLYGIALGVGNGDLVAVAQSQVGNVGGASYWSWYGFSSRVEWCAIFVSWCADQCGLIDSGAVPKFSGCGTGVQWFQSRGQWLPGNATPEPGMLIFFKWYGSDSLIADHVGIVERVENGRIYTIEGNSNDMVRRNSYPVGYGEIKGYGALTPGRVENALLT